MQTSSAKSRSVMRSPNANSTNEPPPTRTPQLAALLRRPRLAWREPPWRLCASRPFGQQALPQFRPSALRLRSSRAKHSWRVLKFRPKANDTQIVFGTTKRSRSRSTLYRELYSAAATNFRPRRQAGGPLPACHPPPHLDTDRRNAAMASHRRR
jgi:hypothetical protein